MKKLVILNAMLLVTLFSLAQNADESSIKKLIRAETDAFYKRDAKAAGVSWQHTPKASITFLSSLEYVSYKGWDSIAANWKRRYSQPATVAARTSTLANYKFNIIGNAAWVEYDQNYPPSVNPFEFSTNHNYRMLVKENGQWKTVSNIITIPESYTLNDQSVENNLNNSGYSLLGQKKMNEAIEVFKLNVKLFPNSWNTYDSLGEAYAAAGDKKLAIENYEKSVQLNPKNDNGIVALTDLKK